MLLKNFVKEHFVFIAVLKNYFKYQYLFISFNDFYKFFNDYYYSVKKEDKKVFLKKSGYNPLYYRSCTTDQGVLLSAFHFEYQNIEFKQKNNTIVILDLGANTGYCSRFFLAKYPAARIISVELEYDNYRILLKNLKAFNNCVCYHAGIWYKDGKISCIGAKEDSFHCDETEKSSSSIDSICLSTLIRNENIKWIDYIKMDIEGAERKIFSDNLQWLSVVGCINLEYHDGDEAFYRNMLENEGFNVVKNSKHWASLVAYNRNCY